MASNAEQQLREVEGVVADLAARPPDESTADRIRAAFGDVLDAATDAQTAAADARRCFKKPGDRRSGLRVVPSIAGGPLPGAQDAPPAAAAAHRPDLPGPSTST